MLDALDHGESCAAEQMLPLVYDQLRKLAASRMALEKRDQTLQPTALVHEAWIRLGGDQQPHWENRNQFFGAAAEAMRRVLVESARRKASQKRGGGWNRVPLEECDIVAPMPPEELLDLDDALAELQAKDPRGAQLVKLRFFVGLTQEEAAQVLGISVATAERVWVFCRTWLFKRIKQGNTSKL